MDVDPERSAVAKRDVERTRLTMFTATELVSVAREPFIEAVGENAHERDLEDPPDQAALGQDVQ